MNHNHDNDDAAFHTVGELRALLDGLPDSARVSIAALPDSIEARYLVTLTAFEGGELRPEYVSQEHRHLITQVSICEVGGAPKQPLTPLTPHLANTSLTNICLNHGRGLGAD